MGLSRLCRALVLVVVLAANVLGLGPLGAVSGAAPAPQVPLRVGADGVIYGGDDQPVRLVGFNWTGTENGGRNDNQKVADACGATWRTPSDPLGDLTFDYDGMYQNMSDAGYNTLRIPVSWNNLEPVAPVWDATSSSLLHSWNQLYLDDLRSMVTKAKAADLVVILDMHQDYWSPALHDITNWDGSDGYCQGVGMPRWMLPSIDAKASTTQNLDFYNAMNWFYRNLHDPQASVTQASPWQLFYSAWDQLAYQFSAASGFADHDAVVGADILNEPYFSYVGGSPPAGQTVLEAAGARLLNFYEALAPAITSHNPNWLLIFEDCTGGYNAANPDLRETPTMTAKPAVPGNWVYSIHTYNFRDGTFSDGVARHDDFGVTVAEQAMANALSWSVPLYIGEFTIFTLARDARELTDSDLDQTRLFLDWAKANRVSWTFWAYVNPYRAMTVVDYATNQPIPTVEQALESGLDATGSNTPPTAQYTPSCSGLDCSFDGSASVDSDGSVVSWAWDFGDGATSDDSDATSHTYAVAGDYVVSLVVTDDDDVPSAAFEQVVTVVEDGSVVVAADGFTRSVAGGWGSADVGGEWATTGPATSSFVDGQTGGLVLDSAGVGRNAYLAGVSSASSDVTAQITVDKAATGGGTYVSVIGRRVTSPATADYRLKLQYLSSGSVRAFLTRFSGGSESIVELVNPIPGLSVSAGDTLNVRFQVVGTGTTQLRAKVWADGQSEPATWLLTDSDETAVLQAAGSFGFLTYVSGSATNTPTTVTFDNLQVGTP